MSEADGLVWSVNSDPEPEYTYNAKEPQEVQVAKSRIFNKWLNSFEYQKRCTCFNKISVWTQEDKDPEYYTDVYVKCYECGEKVLFELPVN